MLANIGLSGWTFEYSAAHALHVGPDLDEPGKEILNPVVIALIATLFIYMDNHGNHKDRD